MNKPDFRILEGIRGIAALIVVLNHARGYFFIGGQKYLETHAASLFDKAVLAFFQLTALGPDAVILFFVLSGFSIAHSVQNGSAGGFYLRRVIRLGPPWIAGLGLAGVAYWATVNPASFHMFIPQYWSLYHEAVFYAMAPLVAAIAWRRLFAALAAIGFVAGLIVGDGAFPANFFLQYAFYFAIGILAYHHRDVLQRLAFGRAVFAAVAVAGVLAMIATIHTLPRVSSLISALYCLVLICNFQSHRITNPSLRHLGEMSYTLYVTHYAAVCLWSLVMQRFGWIEGRASDSFWLWMTAVPACLVVSFAFYLAVERPSIRVLRRMRDTRAAGSAEPARTADASAAT
jgi:peptidoglycan/LPS O-acetylase OafA/YrhL